MTAPLGEREFQQRKMAMWSLLDRIAIARMFDRGQLEPERVLTIETSAPLDPPYDLAYFRYEELYARRPDGRWLMTEYYYEFQQRPPPGRRAHHLHEPYGYHVHCVDPASPDSGHHYRGTAIDVFDAHKEFLYWYGLNEPVQCRGLTPLW